MTVAISEPSSAAVAQPQSSSKATAVPERLVVNRGQLPAELLAIPLWASQLSATFKLCVVCRKQADPIQGFFAQRRDLLDAKVFLGCITDSLGVLEFVELWVQSLDGLAEAAQAQVLTGDAVNNSTIDNRWQKLFEAAAESWPQGIFGCGYEKTNPPPTFLDLERGLPVHPDGWELCRDDALLSAAGLPAFSTTFHRYLCRRRGQDGQFVPLFRESPRRPNTIEYDAAIPNLSKLVPFNPTGGLILVKPAGNLRIGEFSDILGGKPFDGILYGKSRYRFGPLQSLSDAGGGFFYPGEPNTSASRFVETYALKMKLLASMVEEVSRFTSCTHRPLLNIQPSSFAVHLDDPGLNAAALWSSRAMLIDSGDAIPIAIPQGDSKHHFCLPGPTIKTCIYQPASVARRSVQGFGQLFLSAVNENPISQTFDGMLTVVDPIRPTLRDIIRIRIPVAGKRVDLYVKILPDTTASPNLLKFRSVPDAKIKPLQQGVAALNGVPLQEVSYEHFPLFSSACDVFSLTVLAVEILLVPPGGNHAERFRDLLVLASRCRETFANTPLENRIAAIFNEKPEFLRSLGPQWLIRGEIDPLRALNFITPELWYSTLAILVRMLPGHGRDSILADYGDTVQGQMHGAYQVLLPEMQRQIQRARTLLFGEWGMNRMIGSMFEEMRRPQRNR